MKREHGAAGAQQAEMILMGFCVSVGIFEYPR